MNILDKLLTSRSDTERLIQALERIAYALERAFPIPPPAPTPVLAAQPEDLMQSSDAQSYEQEFVDEITWLKEQQPAIYDEIRQKLSSSLNPADALPPDPPPQT
jgi:hypothetical protein